MSVNSVLLDGLAKFAASANIGFTYTPNGLYSASQTGIYVVALPDKPDRAMTLTAVNQGDDITNAFGQVMVQARFRGLPNQPLDTENLGDSVFDVFHGTTNLIFGGVTVVQMNRRVSIPMGQDAAKRFERVDQYYLDVSTPTTTNRPAGGSW
ncbi:phage tail terminator protein [Subtercola vilae]|uniref:Uncharacterized protein n=1 Tax=Subtercola vilae TaxID=2056433 RepID=A0A4T2BRI2_9MICO|nr:minor capsid protein [Subtercola vilae]TIH33679.1 hypothetical protein D4765_14445 [Subtercola vilae]